MIDLLEPLVRNTDPATSHAAARKARKYIAPSHRERILGVLWRPMVASEIAKLTGLTVEQIDRRMPELQKLQEAELTGRERGGYREWQKVVV